MTIFLDIETTGLEVDDKICSIAIIAEDNGKVVFLDDLVNDGKKIPPLASSIHHITNEMVKNSPKLTDSKTYKFLQEHNDKDLVLIGHNIKFDLDKLYKYGFNFYGSFIDTMRVCKHLIPECEIFSLQFLRYELKLYKNEKTQLQAHEAKSDVKLIKLLYEYLLDFATQESMIELSLQNVLMQKLEFGKYSGRYIEDIVMNDRGYLEWMLANIVDLDEDLRYSINYYLQGQIK